MKSSQVTHCVHAVCVASLVFGSTSALAADAVLDTVVVEGDRVNVIPTEPLESVFGFGKTAVETAALDHHHQQRDAGAR